MRQRRYLVILLFLGACTTTKQVVEPSVQLASLYNPGEYSLNISYRVHHASDDMSYLFVRIFPGELLFNQANEDGEYRSLLQLDYMLYELDENDDILVKADSSSKVVKLLRADEKKNAFFSSLLMKIPSGKKYLLRLESKDLLRGSMGLEHVFVDKRNKYSAQNFNILNPASGYPKFQNYYTPGEVFMIRYRELKQDSIYLDFIQDKQPIPKPSVTMNSLAFNQLEIDTTIVLRYSDSSIFTLPDKGMYRFRLDSTREDGVTLNNFGSDFPRVKSEESLMESLFYLATSTEYKQLQEHENAKLAVDEFWLARTSSMERSRELIRIYYNRVLYSNLYFTLSHEGWKSDRGMVFILFGPPDRMKDTGAEQIWYYISRRQGKVISFIFDREMMEMGSQDLVLRKDVEAMNYWSAAVSSWRNGKVYSLSK